MRSPKDHAKVTDPTLRRLLGSARHMAIGLTSSPFWQLLGFKRLGERIETARAVVFPGVGIYARPASSSNPEAIVLNVGGADHPVVIALRDEKTRKASANIDEDETVLFNTVAVLYIKSDGTIEARSVGGTASPLATKADIDALRTWALGHGHPNHGLPPSTTPPAATGTAKLKAE